MGGARRCQHGRNMRPLVVLLMTSGCPVDGGGEGTATETNTATATGGTSATGTPAPTGVDVTGLDTAGTGGPEVPPGACVNPPPPPAPVRVPSFPEDPDSTEVVTVVDEFGNAFCPETVALAAALPMLVTLPDDLRALIHRPTVAGGGWPAGTFNLVSFSHGNGQDGDNYDELFVDLAQRGFVVASIVGDGDVTDDGTARAPRILCVAEALLHGNVAWSGSGHLNGRYAITGHSTGGHGAFDAARFALATPGFLAAEELVAVATIAPNAIDPGEGAVLGPGAPPYFVMQGTGDTDTVGAAPSHYDSVVPTLSGASVTSAPGKVMVWAFDVEHSEYGGHAGGGCPTTAKGVALGTTYFNGFLTATFYNDPTSLDLFFSSAAGMPTPVITPAVSNPALWPTSPENEPQIYGTSSVRVDPAAGYASTMIDGFENGDPAMSDTGLEVVVAEPGMVQESDVASFFDALHIANAAVIGWEPSNEIRWETDLDVRTALAGATTLTFRAGAAVDIVEPAPVCMGVQGGLPTITLIVSDGQQPDVEIDLAPYGRATLPEARDEQSICALGGGGCHAWELMQTTVRVPLGVLCDQGVVLSELQEIGLRFDGGGDTPRVLLLDDVEIRAIPGEPDIPVECRCPP
jgi:hypothetical protein